MAIPLDEDDDVSEAGVLDVDDAAIEDIAAEEFVPDVGFGFFELLLPPQAVNTITMPTARP